MTKIHADWIQIRSRGGDCTSCIRRDRVDGILMHRDRTASILVNGSRIDMGDVTIEEFEMLRKELGIALEEAT